jgi:hypothetical protein
VQALGAGERGAADEAAAGGHHQPLEALLESGPEHAAALDVDRLDRRTHATHADRGEHAVERDAHRLRPSLVEPRTDDEVVTGRDQGD